LPFALGDILSNRLRRSLHGCGGHFQIGEQFHLLPPVIEGPLQAHHRQHAAHARRKFPVLDVEFDVGGELTIYRSVGTGNRAAILPRVLNRFGEPRQGNGVDLKIKLDIWL
jgi:hypothetical protein